jgi:hypothetical protein
LLFSRQNPTFAVTDTIFGADMVPTERKWETLDAGEDH